MSYRCWYYIFLLSAQVNSATVKVPDTDGKKFNIKEGSISMDCIFYEIVSFSTEERDIGCNGVGVNNEYLNSAP